MKMHLDTVHMTQKEGEPEQKHMELHMGPVGAITVEANEALYKKHGCGPKGAACCSRGVFISKIQPRSVLRDAGVQEGVFITAVDGTAVDAYGLGRTQSYLHDPVPFESLMQQKDRTEEDVKIEVCARGENRTHVVSMAWRPEHEYAIRAVSEPQYHREALDYEAFCWRGPDGDDRQ